MKRSSLSAAVATLVLSGLVAGGIAHANPTDAGFPWSMGGLRTSNISQGADNDTYVTFKNPGGDIRKFWPNSAGVDICFGQDSLRLSRARTNYREIVEALNMSGLAGRSIWVAYEPFNGRCYIKAVTVTLQ